MRWVTKIFLCCCGPEPDFQLQPTASVQASAAPATASVAQAPTTSVTAAPRKKDVIPKKVRDAVWVKYHGEADTGICYCCGKSINRYHAGWHCSHILSDVKGGEEIVANLTTCCPHCNLSMGSQNLYVYMKEHNMQGPGKEHIEKYLQEHPDQIGDTRTPTGSPGHLLGGRKIVLIKTKK